MKRHTRIRIMIVIALVSFPGVSSRTEHSYVPREGFVPNEETAIRIAEAVWIPIYGEATIAQEKPFIVEFKGDTWVVSGSLPAGVDGGVAVAEIARRDTRIIRVSHGK